ncbi:hypothetical protein E3N88_20134 [Mikania micrantha]|uniref:Integrase catalytic domain-containing protein n=1 Tax=Mikania micrantha TaxID=192012 RepID=A0A5N6NG51_9ASTR|nr:hypothetical protein E3N88_20134 [Mikania micrantha]
MANNSSSLALPPLPVFKGDGYQFWSIRMKTILMSQDLWEFVNTGYNEEDNDRTRLRDHRKKDARAVSLIQQAVHDEVFSRIAAATTSRKAWNLLQTEYQGDSKVKMVKLQSLRREFKTLQMREGEAVAEYLSRVMKNVNQERSYGEVISDQRVIEKFLRSLPQRWDHVVAAIEKSKDLTTMSFDQLMAECWSEPQVQAVVENEDDEDVYRLVMAIGCGNNLENGIWFLDSGCSNHMSGRKEWFRSIDESENPKVKMGDGKSIQVEGKGKVQIEGRDGEITWVIKVTGNNMFPFDITKLDKNQKSLAALGCAESLIWHQRYGHMYEQGLKLLTEKNIVYGMPKTIKPWTACSSCALGKLVKKLFSKGSLRANRVIELVHADLCGPMSEKSLGGTRIDNESGQRISTLRTDRGGEFCSKEFNAFCEEHGIRRDLTTPYTPEQNGVAERRNRTIIDMVRCMLFEKNLSKVLWGEAVATAVYLLNRAPTKALNDPHQLRKKLDPKSNKCVFVGYCTNSKAYRLFDITKKSIVICRDVVFDEQGKWNGSDQGEDGVPKTVMQFTVEENSHDDAPISSTFEVGESSQTNELSNGKSHEVNSGGNQSVSGGTIEINYEGMGDSSVGPQTPNTSMSTHSSGGSHSTPPLRTR